MSDTFIKDPDATLDYKIDWTAWLGADLIVTSTWSAPEGITIESHENDDKQTVVWLSGGEIGAYSVTNRITTLGGRTDDRTIKIKIKEK